MGHSIPAFLAGSLRDQDKACLWILGLELALEPRTYPLVLGKKTGKLPGYFCGVLKQTQTCDTSVTEVTSLLYLKCHPWERLKAAPALSLGPESAQEGEVQADTGSISQLPPARRAAQLSHIPELHSTLG